jgi:hypothetical protein
MWTRAGLLAVLATRLIFGSDFALAEEASVSPYIDQIKAKMERESKEPSQPQRTSENPDPYIQSVRNKMREKGEVAEPPQGTQPYIDQLKSKNPALNQETPSSGYAEEARSKLAPEETGGAIQAVREGRSDLHLKRPGTINASIGLKMATGMSHSFTGDPSVVANSFETVYGSGWVPDITLQAEYKPFYSEKFGSLGFIGTAGTSIYKASGRFAIQLKRPDNSNFPMTSRTKLTFLSIPVMVGAKYQFNFSHYIRPYAVIGPTLIGMSENRNDNVSARKALSKGLTTSVGGAVLLDWINGDNSWNLYQDFGVKHYYLTVEYTKLTSFSSPVDVSYSGVTAGFAFDL